MCLSNHGYIASYKSEFGEGESCAESENIWLLLLAIIIRFTSLGTGGHTQKAEPVQGAYP